MLDPYDFGCYNAFTPVDERETRDFTSKLGDYQRRINSINATIATSEACMCQTSYELIEILSEKVLLRSGPGLNEPLAWRIPQEWLDWLVEANDLRAEIG